MGVKVTNNAFGTLSAGISSSDTTITVDSGQGARFPTLGAGDYFFGTLVDTSNNLEIVKVTARSSDSMTVTRAQDNTTARAFAIGDRFELRPVAALFDDIIDNAAVDGITSNSTSGTAITIDSSNNVGIGVASPSAKTEIFVSSGENLRLTKATGAYLGFYDGTQTRAAIQGINGADGFTFHTGSSITERLRVDANGNILMPSQPCFSGHKFSGTDGTRSTGVSNSASWTFTDLHINRGSDWNNTAGEFICPVAGAYYAILNFNRKETYNQWHGGAILQNSTVKAQSWGPPKTDTNLTYDPQTLSCIMNCAANDAIVPIYYTAYSDPLDNALENNFSVWFLG